jgi:hypothetical protein
VPDSHDSNGEFVVTHGVKDAIKPLAHAILVVARELFAPRRARVGCEVLVNDAVKMSLAEDADDLAALERQRSARSRPT